MLESLTIRNYAIIDEMTAEFSSGLNVITGETGAGKSIVVDALELVLGARAASGMIRAGESCLEVSGVFTVDARLQESAIDEVIGDDILILRREVRADGNNRCYVNDRPITLRSLKEIGNRLVDFHGQHDHQSLLIVSEHVGYLDGFGKLTSLVGEVKRLYRHLLRLRGTINKLKADIDSALRDRDLYSFQLEEIGNANPVTGEDDELESSIRRLSRASDLKLFGLRVFQELSEADGSIVQRLGELTGEIEGLSKADDRLAPYIEKMAGLLDGAEGVALFFRGYSEDVEDDPSLLAELDERLVLIERLKKKYGPSLDDVLAYRDRIQAELDVAGQSDDKLISFEAELKDVEEKLADKAKYLSEKRIQTGPDLSKEVETHLAELGMSGARLVIDIAGAESGERIEYDGGTITVTENGCDSVEFMITANPGEPPRPLVKVASGGEISRIMLALKLALTDVNSVPSMVFDEIDVGVSGRVAESIGKKLLKLTEKRQALVITHLPQIAAMADHHFSARKRVQGERTLAGLMLLDTDMRQRELASLLSGEKMTDTALAHARKLMDEREISKKEK